MSFIGSRIGIHYRGAMDFKLILAGQRAFSFSELMIQNLLDIACISGFFFFGALLGRCKNIRWIDFLSSVSCSRLPYAIFALVLFAGESFMPGLLPRNVNLHELKGALLLALLGAIFLIWNLALNFAALKESSGLRGRKIWLVFIPALILAEAVSYGVSLLLVR